MEEAYTALYQEFLHLQILCLKQAEMLQQLTEALRGQQAVTLVFNGSYGDLYPQPVHRHDGLEIFTMAEDADMHREVAHTHTSAAHMQPPATPTHTPVVHPAGVTGDSMVSPLAGALNSLHLQSVQVKVEEDGATLPAGCCKVEESSIVDELRQVEQRWYNSQTATQQQQKQRRPWSSSFLTSEMMSEAGGMLMSRVTLQSRVCEFCHAVFPGHTTTRGEFLRHLTTHIS